MIPIVPAIIPQNLSSLLDISQHYSFVHELHVDVVDGEFVENISWPYRPGGTPADVTDLLDAFCIEVDLMTSNPIAAAQAWESVGADMLVFHVESLPVESFCAFVTHTTTTVGVSMHGDTPLDTFFDYALHADYVQLMGISEIGAQGQAFDDEVFDRIKAVQDRFPNLLISVDGSVNEATIADLAAAGVGRLIVGSAIAGVADKEAAYKSLQGLITIPAV